MQYKIPVQVENEDKIVLGLGIRQLSILMAGGGIAYSIFTSLVKSVDAGIALIPAIFVFGLSAVIALFKHTEMTFVPFVLNLMRLNLNAGERRWSKGVDSYTSLEIGYIRPIESEKGNGEKKNTHEAFDSVEDKLGKI